MTRTSSLENGELTDTALHVMLALTRPRHGYAIMQFLTEESGGTITIGPASLYTTLKKLLTAQLITEVNTGDTRRVYQLTPQGRTTLIDNIEYRRRLLAMADQIMEMK